jgi:hypothetical protein
VDDGYGGVVGRHVVTWEGVGALQKVGCISSGRSENMHLERNYRSDGRIPHGRA